jgi:preprotein translocase subunit SecG
MGAAFGSGASGTLFGASGSANFLSRATAVLATVFLASTLALAYFGFSVRSAPSKGTSVLDRPAVAAPAADASAAASDAGAAAIPSAAVTPPAASAAEPAAPSVPASGAAQIPTK